jgi:hypothetical protein
LRDILADAEPCIEACPEKRRPRSIVRPVAGVPLHQAFALSAESNGST